MAEAVGKVNSKQSGPGSSLNPVSNSKLPQHGGEGTDGLRSGGFKGDVSKKFGKAEYAGPGRNL